ncbi:MAG: HEAT repeat domain-containing protein [Anaerolineaceae bacterium]|nr:HEAT repeat domain-containing protein [Anaerolineaceae bacterium]
MKLNELFLPNIPQMKKRKDMGGLVRMLRNESAKTRREAAAALDELEWRPFTPEEKSFYYLAKQDWARLATISEPALEFLFKQIQSENPLHRKEASAFLGELADPRAIQPLLTLYFAEVTLRPEYPDKDIIIQNALRSLEKIGPEQVAPYFEKIIDSLLTYRASNGSDQIFGFLGLGSSADKNRRSNAEMVARMGWIAFNPLVLAIRFKPDARSGAADAISIMKDHRVIQALTKLLADGDPYVRQTAANALGNISDHQPVPTLIMMLEDENPPVRSGAADALGKIGDALAVGPLIKALKDQSWQVRSAAARALGSIGNNRAVNDLILLLPDHNSGSDAAWALGEIGDTKALVALNQTINSSDANLARESTRAIEKIKDRLKHETHSPISS